MLQLSPKESPLWHILDKGPDYSSELTGERKRIPYHNNMWPQCLLRSPQGSGRVILGPHAPRAAVLAVLITPFMVSCAVGIFKSPRPNLRVYLEFSTYSLAFFFFFHFVWYYFSIHSQISSVILQTFNDIRWRKVIGKKKKVCSCPEVGQSKEQEKEVPLHP